MSGTQARNTHPVVTDGAWGTQLQLLGLALGECPDAWNLAHPERVASVARAYVDAGSQVILTTPFGANSLALERYGLADKAAELNRAGARLSREAAEGRAQVYASMGPSRRRLAAGELRVTDLQAAFEQQAFALAEGGAQGLVLETFTDLDELLVALQCARQTGLPVIACMAFDTEENRDRTATAVTLEQAVHAREQAGADGMGANCGSGAAGYVSISQRLARLTGTPLWLKPNAGLPAIDGGGNITYGVTPDEFAAEVSKLSAAGASWVGGCCGSGPDFIRAIARELRSTRQDTR